MSEVSPRVYGTEMEWSSLIYDESAGTLRMPNDSEVSGILQSFPEELKFANRFASNGARIYKDISLPEYATPETTTPMQALAAERAGEDLLYAAYDAYCATRGISRFILSKRTIDQAGQTQGYHVNVSADAQVVKINKEVLYPLAIHLATQTMFTGAGAIVTSPSGTARFSIGQKATALEQDFTTGTTQFKPVMNLRNEAHADNKRFVRIHVTSTDANISPWATQMNLGCLSLNLRSIEQGKIEADDVMLGSRHAQPIAKLARDVALDPTVNTKVTLANGHRVRAIDLQTILFEAAATTEHTDDEAVILREWERALADLREDPTKLKDRADWVAKREVIRRYMNKHDLPLDDARIADIDIKWGVAGKNNLGRIACRQAWQEWEPDESEVTALLYEPPQTTRAKVRGRLVRQYQDKIYSINWDQVHLTPQTIFPLSDPFQTTLHARDLRHAG